MRNAWWCLLGVLAAHAAAAQESQVSFEEPQPVTLTGFAVGQAGYDRALKANGFTAGKMALSLFKPVGDAYFFGPRPRPRAGRSCSAGSMRQSAWSATTSR